MCRFHKDVATRLATNPVTQKPDPVAYAILITAFSRFWVDRRVPRLSECDGYSPYPLATQEAQNALASSGLHYNAKDEGRFDQDVITTLNHFIHENNVTLASLNLPQKNLRRTHFLDEAYQHVYDYADPTRALDFLPKSPNPDYEPLRQTVAAFFATRPDMAQMLESMIDDSIAKIITIAPYQVNKYALRVYEHIPVGLRNVFQDCAMCVRDGGGAAAATHLGCIAIPVISGGGAALMPSLMSAMYVTSPALAVAATNALDYRRTGAFSSLRKNLFSVAAALSVTFVINQVTPHDHHAAHLSKKEFFESLPQEAQVDLEMSALHRISRLPPDLQREILMQAKTEGISPGTYLAICDGTDPLGQKINAFETRLAQKDMALTPVK